MKLSRKLIYSIAMNPSAFEGNPVMYPDNYSDRYPDIQRLDQFEWNCAIAQNNFRRNILNI